MNSKSPKPVKTKQSSGKAGNKSAKAKKDPNAPKKPMTAFMLFSGDQRQIIRGKHPDIKITEVAKQCGQLWREATHEVKQTYQKMAQQKKKEYEEALKTYNNNK